VCVYVLRGRGAEQQQYTQQRQAQHRAAGRRWRGTAVASYMYSAYGTALLYKMGGRLQADDPRCCNVRPRSSAYGYPYCPHGSRGPI
jgi:hypothetical protein